MKRNPERFSFFNPYFIFLLPLFFVFHGFVENVGIIAPWDALLLVLFYVAASLVLSAASFGAYRSWTKAFLFAFVVMEVHFFFGSLHDGLKKLFGDTFFTSYSFVLPAVALFLLAAFVFFKITTKDLTRFVRCLNLVFCCLLLLDAAVLSAKLVRKKGSNTAPYQAFRNCDTCAKPDVYLIVADEYAGHDELKNVFHFDNSAFESSLSTRGFHMASNPRSNYNFTPFSMASALNFSYLPLKDTNATAPQLSMVMRMIADNKLTHFFYRQGYQVFNNSIFDLPREPKQVVSSFLPNKTKYITAQTLLSRLDRDLYYHLVTGLKWEWAIKKGLYANANSNQRLLKKTIETSRSAASPKFSYTHLSMPHWPFYVDEAGRANPYQQLLDDTNKANYLGYLKYSNKVYLNLIDEILKNSKRPPIIIFISDHGFRLSGKPDERAYNFMNICALYTPDKNNTAYYDGLSLVNLFRVLLNQEFGQRLPLLKDVSFFLKD